MLLIRTLCISSLFILGTLCGACAQQMLLEGRIKNEQTQQPVPFATIGIKGTNYGTVADEAGTFRFVIDSSSLSQHPTVTLSSVGYHALNVSINRFKQGPQAIVLSPAITTLQPVTVKAKKYTVKVIGRTSSVTLMTDKVYTENNLIDDNLGKEQATVLRIDKRCFVRDFNMFVAFNRFEQVKFRLHFYSLANGYPDKEIVQQDILFDVTQPRGWQKIDLTPYNIYLEGYEQIAVSIQWVKSSKIDTIAPASFGVAVSPVPFHSTYFRTKSQADWRKVTPAYIAFNLTIESIDAYEHIAKTPLPELAPVLSDSLQTYLNYTKYAEQATQSGYGSSSQHGHYVQLADAKIYYETYGSGAPLLLLHGNGNSIASFYQQIPELAKSYQVIAVDSRAQGRSTDNTRSPFSYEQFASDMKQLLDSLHINSTNVVGWSDGGNTGLLMAIKYPSYVNKLVTMGAVLSPAGVMPAILGQFKQSVNRLNFSTTDTARVTYRLLNLLLKEPHLTGEDLAGIKVPVLVTAGDRDIVSPVHTQYIADHISRSKKIIFKEATHYAPQEQPTSFNQAVIDFLR